MTPPTVTIRRATADDLDLISDLEAVCFPPAEAASREAYAARLATFADRYWLLFVDGEPVSLIGGFLSNDTVLRDEMFADATLHEPDGRVQMIFSVATHPDHRCRGYAGRLIRTAIDACREEGREALVLTCKDYRIAYYASFGFADEGVSLSEHGGATWHQMRIDLYS